jgi:hypothetical protein
MDQIVSHPTSRELAKRMWWLSGDSLMKKSNTPWCPGLRPVISDVQAGGVVGGITERNSAWTPEVTNSLRKGITPWVMSGSRMVKVAPSRPISTVWFLIV